MRDTRVAQEISQRAKALGYSWRRLSEKAGVNESAVKDIVHGKSRSPRHDTLAAIARQLGCTVADLTGEAARTPEPAGAPDPPAPQAPEVAYIPRIDLRLSAGPGAILDGPETAQDMEPWRLDALHALTRTPADKLALVHVSGDSMEPTLQDGDMVLIDQGDRRARDGIFALNADGELMIKRLSLHPARKTLTIGSDNPRHDTYRDIAPEDISIIGRAIWIGRRI